MVFLCFMFQAEDGIRGYKVTGVQTCALPISALVARLLQRHVPRVRQAGPDVRLEDRRAEAPVESPLPALPGALPEKRLRKVQIGRASCREREENTAGEGAVERQETKSLDGDM